MSLVDLVAHRDWTHHTNAISHSMRFRSIALILVMGKVVRLQDTWLLKALVNRSLRYTILIESNNQIRSGSDNVCTKGLADA